MRRLFIAGMLLMTVLMGTVVLHRGAKADSTETHFLPVVFSYSPPAYISDIYRTGGFAGNLRITGEVMVVTSTPVYSITVEIRAYNQFHQLLEAKTGNTEFPATFPGQPNPFDIGLLVQSSQVDYFTAEVKGWVANHPQNIQAATVTNITVIVGGTDATVITTIQNNNPDPLANVIGLAWSLEELNSFYPFVVTNYLAPGATAVFTTTLMGEGGPPGTMPFVKAAAQGEVIP